MIDQNVAGAILTRNVTYRSALVVPTYFAVSQTRGTETPAPHDLPPATLMAVRSGGLVVEVDPREFLVRSSAELVRAIAAALPCSEEDDRLVSARIAEVTGDEDPTPLHRQLDE